MKIGVIGVGYWGRKHVEEYKNLGINEITVVDPMEKNTEFCRTKYGATESNNIDSIIKDIDIEAVSICTPNNTHFEICKKMLLAGKNVLLEKPMTLNFTDASDLIDLSEKTKKKLGAATNSGHNN